MIVTIKEEDFEDIRRNGLFTNSGGCACGDFSYQLEENLWIKVNRSCRKASSTPDDKLWQLHNIELYDHIEFSYYTFNGKQLVDDISSVGTLLENVQLSESSEKKLMDFLRGISKDLWGNEFRNED